jgi:hypothetical protein
MVKTSTVVLSAAIGCTQKEYHTLRSQLHTAKQALEKYADKKNWGDCSDDILYRHWMRDREDGFEIARSALDELEKGT